MNGDAQHEKLELKVSLKRRLTLLNSISLIAGSIIGSGIFVSPKSVLVHSGTPALALLIWFMCGIFSFFGAVCYVELGLTIPKSGSQYIYVMEAFGALPAFLILWIDLILKEPIAKSVTSLAVARYLIEPFFAHNRVYTSEILIAICTLMLLTYINTMSVKFSIRIQDSFFYTKMVALAMIIFIGLIHLSNGNRETLKEGLYLKPESPVKIGLAFYSGLFAYAGWEALNISSEEIKNLKKNLPAAMYISLAIVTVVYTLANISYFAVLDSQTIMDSEIVAVTFIQKTVPVLWYIMPFLVTSSIIGSLNSTVFHSGRMYFSAAREGHLPSLFGMLSIKSMTPIPALLLDCVTSMFVLVLSNNDITKMLEFYGFLRSAALASGVVALLWLRYKRPMLMRPKKFPIIFPIIFLIMSLYMTFVPLYQNYVMGLITLALLVVGAFVYYLFIKPKKVVVIRYTNQPKQYVSAPSSATSSTSSNSAASTTVTHDSSKVPYNSIEGSAATSKNMSNGITSTANIMNNLDKQKRLLGRCIVNFTVISQKLFKVIPCEIEPDYEKLLLEMSR